jgi:hypothetical protein
MRSSARFKSSPWRRSALLAGIVLAALALASVALGAAPRKGATYSGRLKPEAGPVSDGTPISLMVSATGRKVTVTMEFFPLFCQGGGPPQVIRFKKAKIVNGRFKTTGTSTTEKQFGGGLTATATVSGKFLAGGKERGDFEDTFPKVTECGGKTTYATAVGGG